MDLLSFASIFTYVFTLPQYFCNLIGLVTCKLFLANLLEEAEPVLASSRSSFSNAHHWGQLTADMIHIDLQG